MYMNRNRIGRFTRNYWAFFVANPFKALVWQRKVLLAGMVLCAIIPLSSVTGAKMPDLRGTTMEYVANRVYAEEISPDRLDAKIAELKAELLDTLQKCESGGKADIAVIFDANGVGSFGVFQWQPHSFQYYWEKKTGEKITEREAIVKAMDNGIARELASYVIFETDRGTSKDWVICTRNYDLKTKLELIKKLEQ